MINRRGLITGLISLVAAPAIVKVSNLMPVKAVKFDPVDTLDDFTKFIMNPYLEQWQRAIVDNLFYGTSNPVLIQQAYDESLVIKTIKDSRFRC